MDGSGFWTILFATGIGSFFGSLAGGVCAIVGGWLTMRNEQQSRLAPLYRPLVEVVRRRLILARRVRRELEPIIEKQPFEPRVAGQKLQVYKFSSNVKQIQEAEAEARQSVMTLDFESDAAVVRVLTAYRALQKRSRELEKIVSRSGTDAPKFEDAATLMEHADEIYQLHDDFHGAYFAHSAQFVESPFTAFKRWLLPGNPVANQDE